jgi:large subunit ribosomal protein L28
MAYKCDHCGKGSVHGHAVSHAKNRTHRLFKPNLQLLKVNVKGIMTQVKFCTRCIKRLRLDGKIGEYKLKLSEKKVVQKQPHTLDTKVKKVVTTSKKEKSTGEKAKATLDISSIVGSGK